MNLITRGNLAALKQQTNNQPPFCPVSSSLETHTKIKKKE